MFYGYKILAVIVPSLWALSGWTPVDLESNQIFASVMKRWENAQKLPNAGIKKAEEKIRLLKQIDDDLNRLIYDHALSDISENLLLGPVGPLGLDEITQPIAEERLILAKNYFLEGDFQSAQNSLAEAATFFADEISNTHERSQAYTVLAEAKVETGDIQGAREVLPAIIKAAKQTNDPNILPSILSEWFNAFVVTSDTDFALVIITQILEREGGFPVDTFMLAAVTAQSSAGEIASALKNSLLIKDPFLRVGALCEVARGQGNALGKPLAMQTLALALQVAGRIENPDNRARAIINILIAQSDVQARTGSALDAEQSLSEALKNTWNIESLFFRSQYLGLIAKEIASSGYELEATQVIVAASDIAERIDDADDRLQARISINVHEAEIQSEAGNYDGAAVSLSGSLELILGISDLFARVQSASAVLKASAYLKRSN